MPEKQLSLEDELEAAYKAQTKGPDCGVKTVLAALSEKDAAALERYLKEDRLHATTIRDKLRARGIDVPVTSLRRHRNMLQGEKTGVCECRPMTQG